MDTSKTYIKMCEKAEEIQELLDKHEEGNYLYRKFISNRPHAPLRAYSCVDITCCPSLYWLEEYGNRKPAQQWVSHYESNSPDYYGTDVVWLPRQDQLQEMLVTFVVDSSPYKLHLALTRWLECEVGLPPPYTSMEQLWLAFVMKEKYNKVWNKEEWNNE